MLWQKFVWYNKIGGRLSPSSQLWNYVQSSYNLGIMTVQSFSKRNCMKIWFLDEKSWFSTWECQFSFCLHRSLSSSNFQQCLLETQVGTEECRWGGHGACTPRLLQLAHITSVEHNPWSNMAQLIDCKQSTPASTIHPTTLDPPVWRLSLVTLSPLITFKPSLQGSMVKATKGCLMLNISVTQNVFSFQFLKALFWFHLRLDSGGLDL